MQDKQIRHSFFFLLVGLMFFWPLLRTSTTGYILEQSSSLIEWAQNGYYLYLAVNLVTIVFIVLAPSLAQRVIAYKWVVASLGALSTVANLFMALNIQSGLVHPVLLIVSILFLGVFFPFMLLSWAYYLANHYKQQPDTILLLSISFVLSFLLSLIGYLQQPFPYILPVLCPLIAGVFFWIGALQYSVDEFVVGEVRAATLTKQLRGLPWGMLGNLIVILFMSCLLIGIVRQGSIMQHDSQLYIAKDIATILIMTVLVVMLHYVLRSQISLRIVTLFLIIVLCIGLLLILAASQSGVALMGIGIASSARAGLSLFLFLFLLAMVDEFELPPIPVFAAVFLVADVISNILSFVAAPLLQSAVQMDYYTLLRPVAMLIGVVALICLGAFSGSMILHSSSSQNVIANDAVLPQVLRFGDIDLVSLSLSKREMEVTALIAQGYSYRETANLLHITEGTIQSHVKRIYAKLDVHSRQELKRKLKN